MLTVKFVEQYGEVWESATYSLNHLNGRIANALIHGDIAQIPQVGESHMGDLMQFLQNVDKTKNITLIAPNDIGNTRQTRELQLYASEVYLNGELIKSTKENKVKSTDIEMVIREDQMQRLEAIADKIYNSVGPKTWKQKIMGFMFGRAAILSMVGAYFYLGGTSTPTEVIGYDKINQIVSIQESGEIVNLLLKNDTLFQGKDKKEGGFYDTVLNTLLLDQNVVGLQKEKGWFF